MRLSGPRAAPALLALTGKPLPPPRRATLVTLQAGGVSIDKALVLYFPAPYSFTGDDCVELHLHGSRAVVKALLDALGRMSGLRPAEAGEYTRKAFLNGKMDLTAAEGLADLIDAETDAQRNQAMRFMQGDSAAFYHDLRQKTLSALALMEAYIDFPDEDIPAGILQEAHHNIKELLDTIQTQLMDKKAAERVRDGVQVAILGPPNAGKSSLMNLLAQRDVAIVSEFAGTTRDVIEVHLAIGGQAVIVADTAGLREGETEIEREGVRRSLARAEVADIRILVLDAQMAAQSPIDPAMAALLGPNTILLLNKIDLSPPAPLPAFTAMQPILFSVKTYTGMEELMLALAKHINGLPPAESSFIARARHRHHLQRASMHLQQYLSVPGAALELQCEELRRAAVEIGKITGAVSPDEVLGEIFSRFCIGK